MSLRFRLTVSRRGVRVGGVGVLVLLGALLAIPHFLAAPLDAPTAERWIRSYLRRQVGGPDLAKLRAAGGTTPDRATAERWQAQYDRIDALEFVDVAIRHFWLDPALVSSHRLYVARVVLREPDGTERTRYFSLSAENRLFEFFWVNERGRWLWWLAG